MHVRRFHHAGSADWEGLVYWLGPTHVPLQTQLLFSIARA
jgi:hypothetical protein